MAAVKDIVKVPWRASVVGKPAESPLLPSSGGDVTIKQEYLETDSPTPTAALGTDDPRAQIPVNTQVDIVEDAVVAENRDQTGDSTNSPSETASSSASSSAFDHIPRIVQKKHFDIALSEIRPSASEEGSLPELRKVSLIHALADM